MYLGISFVIMLLSPYPPASEVVLDSVGKGKVEIFPSRIMTISAQSVVQMPVERLLHIRHVLHRSNSANRDLLSALLMAFNHSIVSIVVYLIHSGHSARALRFFRKILKIKMLSPGGAPTHDRGQLSKLFPTNLNARAERPGCMLTYVSFG